MGVGASRVRDIFKQAKEKAIPRMRMEDDEDGHERPPETCTKTRWFQICFIFTIFHPYLGKISNLTNIFQRGWNHQLENMKIGLFGPQKESQYSFPSTIFQGLYWIFRSGGDGEQLVYRSSWLLFCLSMFFEDYPVSYWQIQTYPVGPVVSNKHFIFSPAGWQTIGSMGLVYLPTFTIKINDIHVGSI